MYDVHEIAALLTEDPDVTMVISENVERLIPHLKDDIYSYLAAVKEGQEAGWALDKGMNAIPRDKRALDEWVDDAVAMALQADPKYIKAKSKNKPESKTKAPFVRQILKWWLDPRSTDNIIFPDDAQIVAETLNNFNLAKQKGLNKNVSDYDSYNDLREDLAEYMDDEGEIESDEYTRMGLELVFQDGPWKLYHVPEWIPGKESTLHRGDVCHAALGGTAWCVQYQQHWGQGGTTKRELYLLLKGGKRVGLLDFGNWREFKDTDNKIFGSPQSSTTTFDDGVDFLQRFLQDQPAREMLFGRANLGDFRIYAEMLNPLLEREFAQNPNLARTRLKNGEFQEEDAPALIPTVVDMLEEDPEWAYEMFREKRLGNFKVFTEQLRPYYREFIAREPEYVEEVFRSKESGDIFNWYNYKDDDPVEESKKSLISELRPYFAEYIRENPKYVTKLFSSKQFGDMAAFSDLLKPLFTRVIRQHPELITELWRAATRSYGHLGDLNEFRDILNPYFTRLNAQERTGGDDNTDATRLVYRKEYAKRDPVSALLGEEPEVTTISMREFGTEFVEDWMEENQGTYDDIDETVYTDDDHALEEVEYVIAREITKGGKTMRYKPILTIGWNPDVDKIWIAANHEGNIDRFGPIIKDFFQSMVTDPRSQMPQAIRDKISEYL